MSRTTRNGDRYGPRHKTNNRDGAASMRGMERCPPKAWRSKEVHRKQRAADGALAHEVFTSDDLDALTVVTVHRPYYT